MRRYFFTASKGLKEDAMEYVANRECCCYNDSKPDASGQRRVNAGCKVHGYQSSWPHSTKLSTQDDARTAGKLHHASGGGASDRT